MVPKYAIKGLVKDCTSWSQLGLLTKTCRAKKLISGRSALKLEGELFHADRDNVGDFHLIQRQLISALEGKAI